MLIQYKFLRDPLCTAHRIVTLLLKRVLQFVDAIKVQKELLSTSQGNSASGSTKNDIIKAFYGSCIPTEVSVHSPQQAQNKGCGKRIKGGKEKAIEVSQKTKRLCRKSNKKGYHDSRNCALNSEE
ncbi:unnamed protein product [Cuscuta epithymum]|uniref:Uncharacterized protein n=1 Tax=Cuscuta epithymum TaxID=186058 RepID=A0AAV0E7G1_9ASTE|nr:unnamed protein product [Cuscuta epithymum]CAH9132683.1 unnamed protein product [Cuscuta epithymum]